MANDPEGKRIPIPGPGRDALWTDPDEMYAEGLQYFIQKDQEGKKYTLSGLALHLGMGYQALNEYFKKPAFHDTLNRLRARITEQGENGLWDKDCVNGAKFHLSILGMKDTQQIEVVSKNTNLNANVDAKALESLTDEQLARISEAVKLLAVTGADRSGDTAEETQSPSDDVPRLGSVSP